MGHQDIVVTSIALDGDRRATVVHTAASMQPIDVVAAFGLPPMPVIAINGGTEAVADDIERGVLEAMGGVVEIADRTGAALVTGGTDAGIFRLLGRQVELAGAALTMIGVAPLQLVHAPGSAAPADAPRLERHHTHFLLTEGDEWGDETATMLSLVPTLAGPRPTVAIVAGGGSVTKTELAGHLRAHRPVILLRGSGRLADEAARSDLGPDVSVIDLAAGSARVADALGAALHVGPSNFGAPRQPPSEP